MPRIPLSHPHTLNILQLIRSKSSISRAKLAEIMGASLFLVSKSCDELLAQGFVSEAGQGDSTGGRRPSLLSLKPGLGRLIGVHFGTVNVRIAMTDFSGNLMEYIKAESRANEGPEIALQHLIDLLDQMLKKTGTSYSELNGIGIGISGVVERTTGTTLFWPKLPLWMNVPVKKNIREALQHLDRAGRHVANPSVGGISARRGGFGQALYLHRGWRGHRRRPFPERRTVFGCSGIRW